MQDFDRDDLESVLKYLTGRYGIEILAGQGKTAGKEDVMKLLPDFFSPSSHKGDYSMLGMMAREGIMKELVVLKQSGKTGDELRRRMFAEKSKLTDNYIPEDVADRFMNMIAGIMGLEVPAVVVQLTPMPAPAPQPAATPTPTSLAMSDEEFVKLCASGDVAKVEEALRNGANVNATDNKGYKALHWAASKGHTEVAELLLQYEADINATDNKGYKALHFATDKGHADVAEILLKHGADVNAKNNDGVTALHLAADKGHADVAEVLLKHGANVNAQENNGKTALHWAKTNEHSDVAELLRAYGARPAMSDKDFARICVYGSAFAVEEALKNGGSANAIDEYGDPVLTKVIRVGEKEESLKKVECLLRHGANVNAKMRFWGSTPLLKAASEGYAQVVEVLLKHGADINAKDYEGMTALMLAARRSSPETVEVLLKHGANTDAKNKKGMTALMVAVDYHNVGIAEVLLKYGVNVNADGNFTRAALHVAAFNGETELVKLLLRYGADVNAMNGDGRTALEIAEERSTEVARLLRAHGAR